MTVSYSDIAARGLERISALSDGVFAIAMTLIVLEIHVPDPGPIQSEQELLTALTALTPRIVTYGLSFLTLGIFWSGQQTQLNHFARGNRDLAWIHLAFLALVALMPFSTSLLAEFITFRLALLLYWANIFLLGVLIYVSWAYAWRAGLVKEDTATGVDRAIRRRILIAQALYAFGAALCLISTYWSIAFIVLVQLNFAIGPRIRALSPI
ncbi:MAG: TMEM175 family protein [Chloroflexota bacterium]|nr:TMEM175 family protein [Chloroflexota bacterium]